MKLNEIDATTEDTYYRCLHDEIPADPRVMAMRRQWRATYQPLGHRAKVLVDDDDQVVGLTNYIPIEHSPYEGENLMAILCMWIHGYDHLVGNQQSRGYGRFMLEQIEADAHASGHDGVCVWAKDYDDWNPIAFYEHMGYVRCDQRGLDVLAFKAFNDQAKALFLMNPTLIAVEGDHEPDNVRVATITNGWCGGGCTQCIQVSDWMADMQENEPEIVNDAELLQVYAHTKEDIRKHGESIDALYIGGETFMPDGPPVDKVTFQDAVRREVKKRRG